MSGTGQHNADGILSEVGSHAVEELVNWRRLTRDVGRQWPQLQPALPQCSHVARRDNMDLVWLYLVLVRRLEYRHAGPAADDLRQHAFVVCGQVQDHDEAHAAVDGHALEEGSKGFYAAGRSADRHDPHGPALG